MSDEQNKNDIDGLLNSLLKSYNEQSNLSLKERFELKLSELNITKSQGLEILGIPSRSLIGILEGSAARIDFKTLLKLSYFLNIPKDETVSLFLDSLKDMAPKIEEIEKRKFIVGSFDLPQLRKAGFIDSITDFKHIEKKVTGFFGYDSIFDYRKDALAPAFSSAKLHKKNSMVDWWIESAYQQLRRINNHYEYNRKSLIDYFPNIRWHSLNVEKGLLQVIRDLYKIGITVIYQPKLPTIHLRGATFAVNGRPCIVITDYRGFYPTLWFALIHELHHVLFDLDQIMINAYHISDEPNLFEETEIENDADKFARDYLFSNEKLRDVIPHIKDKYFVNSYAKECHVHPSIVYSFYAFDASKKGDKKAWMSVKKFMPDINICLESLGNNPWQKPIKEVVQSRKQTIFNI